MAMRGGWIVDVDIQGFFDALDHRHLRALLDQRIRDGVLRRTIDKWLKACVFEERRVHSSDLGTPQGGVISPLLANVYLHDVLDLWFEGEVRPRMRGRCFCVRYADDVVFAFEHETDARRFLEVLPKRLGRFGLTMHSTKTRLVRFGQPKFTWRPGDDDDFDPPETFDFLGFTHYWGVTRKGGWAVKRKTAKDRFSRAVKSINQWCRFNRHLSVKEQHAVLSSKLRGHCAYYGITGNGPSLSAYSFRVTHLWQKWLNRRSQRKAMPWVRFLRLLARYPLPRMRIWSSTARA